MVYFFLLTNTIIGWKGNIIQIFHSFLETDIYACIPYLWILEIIYKNKFQ